VRRVQEQFRQRAGQGTELLDLSGPGAGDAAAVHVHQLGWPITGGPAPPALPRIAGLDMLLFIVKRVLWMIPSLFAVSFLAFVLIQLPPGDFVTNYIATLAASNEIVDQHAAAALR